MLKKHILLFLPLALSILLGCSRRTHPAQTAENPGAISNTSAVKKSSASSNRIKEIPKVIIVSDSVAKKSIDGRYYYDLNGHRYWRNNRDGKYYLFNRSMYTDDAFRKQ